MICFGANTIHMSLTAELGPVDPQVQYEHGWISAQEYIRSYEQLMLSAASGKHKRIEPFLQQLNRYDARFVEQLKSHQELSADISVRLLKTGMMQGQTDEEIRKRIEVFLSQQMTNAHGRMINPAGVQECGLKVTLIELGSELWNNLWELYVRSDWVVSNGRRKLIESCTSSVHA